MGLDDGVHGDLRKVGGQHAGHFLQPPVERQFAERDHRRQLVGGHEIERGQKDPLYRLRLKFNAAAVGLTRVPVLGNWIGADGLWQGYVYACGKQRNIGGWARRYWSAPERREKLEKKLPWLAGWMKRQ